LTAPASITRYTSSTFSDKLAFETSLPPPHAPPPQAQSSGKEEEAQHSDGGRRSWNWIASWRWRWRGMAEVNDGNRGGKLYCWSLTGIVS